MQKDKVDRRETDEMRDVLGREVETNGGIIETHFDIYHLLGGNQHLRPKFLGRKLRQYNPD